MDPKIIGEDSSIYKESFQGESKVEEFSKMDESLKLVNYNSQKSSYSNYSINRQGADNRRNLFEQVKLNKHEINDISGNTEFDRWEEVIQDEPNQRPKQNSTFKKGQFQNLEVQVPPTKKIIDQEINFSNMIQFKQNEFDISMNQSPFGSKKFFDQRYQNMYNLEDHRVEFDKDRSDSQQESSQQVMRQNTPSILQIDTPNGVRSVAKARRQTHIALKMKGVFNSLAPKTPLDDSLKSPNNSRKLSKILQNQFVGQLAQSLPTSTNQSHIGNKDAERAQLNQGDEKTIMQDDETHFEQSKKQHLIILTYMKRFINQLLKRLSYQKFDLLTESHLQMIGDSSIPPQIYKKIISKQNMEESQQLDILTRRRAQFNNLLQKKIKDKSHFFRDLRRQFRENSAFYQFMSRIPIIQPQSSFIITWESLLLFILFFYLLFTPLKTSFEFDIILNENFSMLAYKVPIFIFCFDIFLGFQTGYYELGQVVTKRKLIAIRYIQKKFLTDLMCTLMMFLNNFIINSDFIEIIILMFRINQVNNQQL